MEIRVDEPGAEQRNVAVTMRTPGHDFELAAGFLFTEGLIAGRRRAATSATARSARGAALQRGQRHGLTRALEFDRAAELLRHVQLRHLRQGLAGHDRRPMRPDRRLSGRRGGRITGLPPELRKAQRLFECRRGARLPGKHARHRRGIAALRSRAQLDHDQCDGGRSVAGNDGHTLTIKYKDGEKKVAGLAGNAGCDLCSRRQIRSQGRRQDDRLYEATARWLVRDQPRQRRPRRADPADVTCRSPEWTGSDSESQLRLHHGIALASRGIAF